MNAKTNIAARAAKWSATHRKAAIFGWLAFVIVAVLLGGAVGQRTLTDAEATSGEAGRAAVALERSGLDPHGEVVLVQSKSMTAGEPAFDAAVSEATRRLGDVGSVSAIDSPAHNSGGQVSADGHSALIEFQVSGNDVQAEERVDASLAATAATQRNNPDLRVEQFGDASANKTLEGVFNEDLEKAGKTSLPITLLILLVAFGALVAALVPLLLAISSVVATMGLLALPSQLVPMDSNVSAVVLLVGLAVGVDYSLFYLRREREERRKGRTASAALEAAAATSGRAVLVSGLTVIGAMAGMLLSGDPTFTSFAVATMTVVAVAMLASLTVLPAVLSKLGDRVEKGRIPFLSRLRRRREGRSAWGAVIDGVMRRPVLSVILAGGALVALAVPALSLHTKVSGADDLPRDIPIVQTYDHVTNAFPGEGAQSQVVVEADDTTSGPVAGAIGDVRRAVVAEKVATGPVSVETSPDGSVTSIEVPTAGRGSDAASTAALENIRERIVPAAFAGVSGASVNVAGDAAESKDFNELLAQRLPLVIAFVLGMAFLLMLVTFRSIVVPIKAIVLNLLSVGAAYGVLVLVFQEGLGESLLGFHSNGGVSSWVPMFLFVILFGLSMDYHVLILSRVREGVDRGMSSDEAVRRGIRATAGTVTSAAIVMVAVFSVFATLTLIDMKEMGIGLAVAVLIDATLVRAILLPATMKLLGDRNWYLPSALGWLPRVNHSEPEVEPARA
jgi:RND superfamily putative drug exporter